MKRPKAIVLVSGGLDSTLVLKILQEQNIDLLPVTFTFPLGQKKGIPLGEDYLKVVRNPKHGHGKGINPCIDCKIYMLKKAKALMKNKKAQFIATGEVLGQRPMSQHFRALQVIEQQAGLKGKILRPLSAKLLPITVPEKKGLVDREKLLAIQGRSRKEQMALAKKYGIQKYSTPAGGCFLTGKEFAKKLRDLLEYKRKVTWDDVRLLRMGRHFRFRDNKVIVGRNEAENNLLLRYKQKNDYSFEVADFMGPITILQGKKSKASIEFAAALTLLYSDCKEESAVVKCGSKKIKASAVGREEANRYNLTL